MSEELFDEQTMAQDLSGVLEISSAQAEEIIVFANQVKNGQIPEHNLIELTNDQSGIAPRILGRKTPRYQLVVSAMREYYDGSLDARLHKIANEIQRVTGVEAVVLSRASTAEQPAPIQTGYNWLRRIFCGNKAAS